MQKKNGYGSFENRKALQWKMHRYSKMRAWRSVDFEEPTWKDLSDLKKPSGIINIEQIQATDPPNESSDEGQGGQLGDVLSRTMSLKENAKDRKPAKKISYRNPDAVPRDNSLQSAVRRVFSMRKPDPPRYFQELISRPFVADLQGVNRSADWPDRDDAEGEAAGKKSFKRAECMKYSRIAAPPAESDPGGGDASHDGMKQRKKKEKKSVFRACRRLLGMKKDK